MVISKGALKALGAAIEWATENPTSNRPAHFPRLGVTRNDRGSRLKVTVSNAPTHGMLIDVGIWADEVCENVWVQYQRMDRGLLISVIINEGEVVWEKEVPYLYCSIRDKAGRSRMTQTITAAFQEAGDACLRLHALRQSTQKQKPL